MNVPVVVPPVIVGAPTVPTSSAPLLQPPPPPLPPVEQPVASASAALPPRPTGLGSAGVATVGPSQAVPQSSAPRRPSTIIPTLPISIGGRKSTVGIEDRRFICEFEGCGAAFVQLAHLKIHTRRHTGERPFVCQVCGKSFNQQGNLRTHERKHSGDKPFKCTFPDCGKSFAQMGNLRTHEKLHMNTKRHQCDKCEKTFAQLGNLKAHVVKVHERPPAPRRRKSDDSKSESLPPADNYQHISQSLPAFRVMEGVPQFSAHLPPYRFDQAGGEDHDDDDDDGEEDQDFRPKQDDDHELMFRQDGDDLGRPHDGASSRGRQQDKVADRPSPDSDQSLKSDDHEQHPPTVRSRAKHPMRGGPGGRHAANLLAPAEVPTLGKTRAGKSSNTDKKTPSSRRAAGSRQRSVSKVGGNWAYAIADTSSTVLPSYPNYIYQLSASAPASSVAFTGVGADSGVYVNSDEEGQDDDDDDGDSYYVGSFSKSSVDGGMASTFSTSSLSLLLAASSRVNESGAGGGVYDVAASAPATASSRVVGGSMSVTPMFPSSLYSASLASEHGSLARRPGGLREGGLPSVSGAVAAAAAAATGAISNAGAAGRDFRPFGFDSAGNSEDRMEVSSGVGAFTASNSLRQIDTRQHLAPPQQWRRHRADSIVSEDGRLTPNPNGRPSPRFFDDAIDDGGATDASSAAGILGSAHSLEDAEAALVLASVGRMTLNRGGGKATNSAAPPAPAGTFVDFGQLESRQSPNITLPTSGTSSGLTNLMRSSAAKPPLGPSSVAPLQTLSHGTSVPAVAANPSPSLPQFSTVGGSVGAPQGYPIGSVSALSGSAPNYSPLSSRLKPLRAKTTSAEYSIMTEFVEAVARRT